MSDTLIIFFNRTIFFLLVMLLSSPFATAKNDSTPEVQKIPYGFSFEGEPLIAYKVFHKKAAPSKKAILFTEGVHGNEYNGMLSRLLNHSKFKVLIKGFLGRFLDQGGELIFIPKVNPDAIKLSARNNVFGSDLNRDFLLNKLQSQESYFLSKWLDKELKKTNTKLVIAIDYHCCGGALLYPEVQSKKEQRFYQTHFKEISSVMNKSLNQDFTRSSSKNFFGERKIGTLKNYLFEKYGTLSFTFEAHDLKPLSVNKHLGWWQQIANHISKKSFMKGFLAVVHKNSLNSDKPRLTPLIVSPAE